MAWYNTTGKNTDTVISSRVRLARNLSSYNFTPTLKDEDAQKIIECVSGALDGENFEKLDFSELSTISAAAYIEKHYASREFAAKKGAHTLLFKDEDNIAIMLCEEDHIRLQSILPGLDLESAYANVCKYDDILDSKLDIAYDENLGYLTSCPTNLGTGLRASVMMFLPAITMANRIGTLSNQLSKIGLTIRGMYGEGSESKGCLYQISNQVTLGITEEDTLKKLNDVISQINEQEKSLRGTFEGENRELLCDRILRSEGILRYAHMLSSTEFMKLWADVRLGVSMGIITDIDLNTLGSMLIGAMPATLTLSLDIQPQTSAERDRARAKYIKSILK